MALKLLPIIADTAGAIPAMSDRNLGVDRRLASQGLAHACFFRSRAQPGRRKLLLQITERCDLHCAHCLVSATQRGSDITLDQLTPSVMDRLLATRIANVTVTGGEPLVHPQLIEILGRLVAADLDVTVCTNGVKLTTSQLDAMVRLERVKVNVSIDGFSPESHGRFRGDPDSFAATVRHSRQLARAGLLKGILSTPNALSDADEYTQLYLLARELGAKYLLMNPLSSFGRGYRAQSRLRATDSTMRAIRRDVEAERQSTADPEPVFIRFPNRTEPLTGCVAGEIFYIFTNGDGAVCPYLVFAARNPGSQHHPEEFIFANLFRDDDFAQRLERNNFHERYRAGSNPTCTSCSMRSSCGTGCPAMVIADGGRLGGLDHEVCPIAPQAEPSSCS